jgi:hypothetical protein
MASALSVRRAADANDIDSGRPRTPSPSEVPSVHFAVLAFDRARAVGMAQGLIDRCDVGMITQPRSSHGRSAGMRRYSWRDVFRGATCPPASAIFRAGLSLK